VRTNAYANVNYRLGESVRAPLTNGQHPGKAASVPVFAFAWYPITSGELGFREAEAQLKFKSWEMDMTYRGKVEKGTVVLPPEANLPDGTEVRVEPVAPKTLAERLKHVIGIVHARPPDWAENHDHYIHGTPKK